MNLWWDYMNLCNLHVENAGRSDRAVRGAL